MHQDSDRAGQVEMCAHLLPQVCLEPDARLLREHFEKGLVSLPHLQELDPARGRHAFQAQRRPQNGCNLYIH